MSNLSGVFAIGPRICGQILGDNYSIHRPIDATKAITGVTHIATLPAWITADKGSKGSDPLIAKNPMVFGLFDISLTLVGDYMVGPLGTFFIASQSVPHPIALISCNAIATISQPANIPGFGAQTDYGGDQRATEVIVATSWPCSLIQGTKGERGDSKLPGDVRQAWWAILLPPIPGVTITNNMILTVANGTRYVMSSTELTSFGWRITAALATT